MFNCRSFSSGQGGQKKKKKKKKKEENKTLKNEDKKVAYKQILVSEK